MQYIVAKQWRDLETLRTPPLSDECERLLGWVGLGDKDSLKSQADWCHFVRAISFHKETAKKDFEARHAVSSCFR